jgi:hypothetical protein
MKNYGDGCNGYVSLPEGIIRLFPCFADELWVFPVYVPSFSLQSNDANDIEMGQNYPYFLGEGKIRSMLLGAQFRQ